MGCPIPVSITTWETAAEIAAAIHGPLGQTSVSLLAGLADRVRAERKPLRLDLTLATSFGDGGLAALVALQQAADDVGVTFELEASGKEAAAVLAQAGLARVLYRGP